MLLFRSRFPGFSPFSRPGFPCLVPVVCTRLSVSFLSPFLASLPQLFRKCLPGSVPLSVHFPLAFVPFSAFFRPLVFGLWLLSLCFFLSPLPGFPSQWFFPVLLSVFRLLLFRFLFLLFPGLRFRFWYLAFLQFLFPFSASALQVLSQFPTSSFEHGRPHSFRLRFVYSGRVMYPEN